MELDCEEFLEIVYGDRQGWIDLPAKVGAHWVPFYTEWPNESAVTRRIDSSLRDREDLYYSVAQFTSRGRRIENVMESRWLWADLDEVHPASGDSGLLPTIAVESSPGRYQALWKLSRAVKPTTLEKLNRGLTYALDADKGGWDLTQVLRIPGTRNFKYESAPMVKLLWAGDGEYDPQEIWDAVKRTVPARELRGIVKVPLPRKPISRRAKTLLRASADQVVEGERSARLWELECLLAEAGLGVEEIYELVVESAWNKWRGVASGRARLEADIRKAVRHVGRQALEKESRNEGVAGAGDGDLGRGDRDDRPTEESDGGVGSLPWVSYSSFMAMAMEEPRWLVEEIWTAGSHGIIAGEPKTNKTTLALALALAVASGESFLGEYPVGVQGPVLFVQEENAPWLIQDRMRKIASYMGLLGAGDAHVRPALRGSLGVESVELDFPSDLPLKVLNNFGFDLSMEDHREMLEGEVENIRPKLLVLDPLYLIFGGAEENSTRELQPYLKWLLHLRYEYETAIILIHHFRKQNAQVGVVRPGQRVRGSGSFHGWVDSALYLSALDEAREGWVKVQMEREFRSVAPQRSMEVSMTFGPPGSLEMSAEINAWSFEKRLMDYVLGSPGITVNALAEAFSMDPRTVLARCRGSENMVVETGKRGRGHTHKVFLNGTHA